MKRREFNKIIAAAGVTMAVGKGWTKSLSNKEAAPPNLPAVAINNFSVEECLNSRYSFHSGYSAKTTDQIIANTLWATAVAPLIAEERIIYVALSDNLYTYKFKDGNHVLEVHQSGDKRTESATAFEIGVATTPAEVPEDAGAALHWAHLASVAFWATKNNQPACCPKDSATNAANGDKKWNPVSKIHLVNCYGQSATVNGIVKNVVAISSDKSLADPVIDTKVKLEEAMQKVIFGTEFLPDSLSQQQIAQILWASYGCTPHSAAGAAGLTVASWMAKYFISGKIYLVTSEGVKKYHVRDSKGSATSKDHRLENISTKNVIGDLRNAIKRLPQSAPVYIVFCGSEAKREQLIEAGYCGSSALLQATALGLQGHYCGRLTSQERSAIQSACGIPATDIPLVVFSAGKPSKSPASHQPAQRKNIYNVKAQPNPFKYETEIHFTNSNIEKVNISIFDYNGKMVFRTEKISSGTEQLKVKWDGKDTMGRIVAPGFYTCIIRGRDSESTIVLRKI
ncbi:MAG: nitroreductase family protein [Chitinispirillaceae bacterium]|nr:nitroreductase family protein [Chitinispirillaceae bacterium]